MAGLVPAISLMNALLLLCRDRQAKPGDDEAGHLSATL